MIKLLVASVSIASLGVAGCSQQSKDVQAQERPPTVQAPSPVEPSTPTSADVQALVRLGPRVAGTPVMDKASTYLIQEYRQAGYVTEVQTFTVPNTLVEATHFSGRL
jgi:hypothetical protein